jgi:D-glycero-alpha-D-manno-heptose-7-phosphate kinase
LRVIRSRAPLRLGLAGGGTDVSPYADTFGGNVINVTIDKYAYASIRKNDHNHIAFNAVDLSLNETYDPKQTGKSQNQLKLHRGVLERISNDYDLTPSSITITTHIDAPLGSGLGSSSALVVALVGAFREFYNLPLGSYEVAHLAYEIERLDLNLEGGRQDQYAATFGGFNFIEFGYNDHVLVNPLRVNQNIHNELESSILLAFTGASRESSRIISSQTKAVGTGGQSLQAMHQINQEALMMKKALLTGNINEMAELLRSGWEAKKQTSSAVSTPMVEALFKTALENGAIAGKLSGAGGGGFAMFIVDPDDRPRLSQAIEKSKVAYPSKCRFTLDGLNSWAFG